MDLEPDGADHPSSSRGGHRRCVAPFPLPDQPWTAKDERHTVQKQMGRCKSQAEAESFRPGRGNNEQSDASGELLKGR